jgi:hypothetical protein
MRIGFTAFSSALTLDDRSPKPIAPPAPAETLMKFLLVVDVICSSSMIAVFSWRNRAVRHPINSPAFVIDAPAFDTLESRHGKSNWGTGQRFDLWRSHGSHDAPDAISGGQDHGIGGGFH